MTDLEVTTSPEGPVASSNSCGCERGSGQFCGVDGMCHFYNCQSWYEFGAVGFTGYDADAPLPLECLEIDLTQWGDPGMYPSVSFRCRDLQPEPVRMGFNKECIASGKNSKFTCYELAQGTNFTPFLDEASAAQLNCTTGDPFFAYQVTTESWNGTNIITAFQLGFNETSEFNETFALTGTMQSRYEEWTAQPTSSPTPSPTPSSSYPAMVDGLWLGLLLVGFLF